MTTAVVSRTDRPDTHTGTPSRRFRLLDAMILVAATAIGCWMIEWAGDGIGTMADWTTIYDLWVFVRQSPRENWHAYLAGTLGLAYLAAPFVLTWTLALIPIRLLGPRPRSRRMMRQPGTMAAFATCATLFFLGLEYVLVAMVFGLDSAAASGCDPLLMLPFLFPLVALAIMVSWMTLLVGRRWRAEPSWVDRLGRAMGVYLLLVGPTTMLFSCLGWEIRGFHMGSNYQPPAEQVSVDNGSLPESASRSIRLPGRAICGFQPA